LSWNDGTPVPIMAGTPRRYTADGSTDFSTLQNEKGRSSKIALVAFDLLYLNGYDLRKLPLIERKALLKRLIANTAIQFSESFEVDGPEMFKHACGIGLEGVVVQGPCVKSASKLTRRLNTTVPWPRASRISLYSMGTLSN